VRFWRTENNICKKGDDVGKNIGVTQATGCKKKHQKEEVIK
jgi:hypothetical protein